MLNYNDNYESFLDKFRRSGGDFISISSGRRATVCRVDYQDGYLRVKDKTLRIDTGICSIENNSLVIDPRSYFGEKIERYISENKLR